MPSLFISYSWKDRSFAQQVIVPFLERIGIHCFIDYEKFELRGPDDALTAKAMKYTAQVAVGRLLESSALEPWQTRVVEGVPSSSFPREIERAIAAQDIHLVLMSRPAAQSFWVARETDFSLSLCRRIVVARLDNAPLPERLATLVNCGIIPNVEFTGAPISSPHDPWETYILNLNSANTELRERAVRQALEAEGIRYRQPTSEDFARLEDILHSTARTPEFDFRAVKLQEVDFTLSENRFRFVRVSGLPYFRPLAMLKFPVTKGQFSLFQPECMNSDFTDPDASEVQEKSEAAATNLSWNAAKGFCAWLCERTGNKIRMPYEVEWETMCRSGSAKQYCFGDAPDVLNEYGFTDTPFVHPVGKKKPNAWGMHDMHGTVSEWCEDILDVGAIHSIQTPRTFRKLRVVRGGAGFLEPHTCTSSFRFFDTADSTGFLRGFRLVWEQ